MVAVAILSVDGSMVRQEARLTSACAFCWRRASLNEEKEMRGAVVEAEERAVAAVVGGMVRFNRTSKYVSSRASSAAAAAAAAEPVRRRRRRVASVTHAGTESERAAVCLPG